MINEWRLTAQNLDCVTCAMCWCIVLLEDKHVPGNSVDHWQQFLHQQLVSIIDFSTCWFFCTRFNENEVGTTEFWHRNQYQYGFITFRVGHSRGEMYSGHGRLYVCVCLYVCLSVAAFPHYCTHLDVTWVPSSCALLGGFAIGSQVPLLWQHSAEREMSASAFTRSMSG